MRRWRAPASSRALLLTLGLALAPAPGRAAPAAPEPLTAARLAERARREGLFLLRAWQRLGHYRLRANGTYLSDVDGEDFFLAEDGARDPAAELEATILAFFEAPAPDRSGKTRDGRRHAQCRFPARLALLRRLLPLDAAGLPHVRCPKLEAWLAALSPGAATLVFAASYLNSPASMYGHTFLRIDRADGAPDLLAYAISYAAVPWTNFPPLYAILGLTGGFPGRFTSVPYYLQVQTYSEVEHRDLWEYHLALDRAQVLQLVRHAWELGQSSIDYFFIDENCSYHLLSLIEAADPSLRLSDRFSLYTIPIDTARVLLDEPGLVRDVRWRPSHVARMQARRAALARPERHLAERVVAEGVEALAPALAALSPARRAAVLDAADDLFVYRHGLHDRFGKGANTPERRAERAALDALVSARARIPLPSPPPPLREPVRPDQGHASARFEGAVGLDRLGPLLRLEARPAYHDPTDPQAGFDADTALEFLALHLNLRPWRRSVPEALLPSLDLIRIASLTPYGRWIRQPSWRIRWSMGVPEDRGCVAWRCAELRLTGGPGIGLRPFSRGGPTLAAFLDLDLALTPGMPDLGRVGLALEGALFASLTEGLRLVLRAAWREDLVGGGDLAHPIRASLEIAWRFARGEAVRLALAHDGRGPRVLLGLRRYF